MSTMTLPSTRGFRETLLSDRLYRGSTLERDWRERQPLPRTSMQAEFPVFMPFGDDMIVIETKPDASIVPTLEQVCQLGSLPPNWDSYGSLAIKPEIALKALELILNLLQENDPKPSIVPTCRGGIVLEWHTRGIDLEIEILSSSGIQLSFENEEKEEEIEQADLEAITEKLNILRGKIN